MISAKVKAAAFGFMMAMGLVGSTVAQAQTSPTGTVTPADLKLLHAYFKSFVYELENPIKVFHYSQANPGSYLATTKSASDPIGPRYVINGAQTYWVTQNNIDDDSNMYGRGLYAALDPVATRSYGKWEGNWILLEMNLPKGFRMLDLARDGGNSFPQRIQEIFTNAKCPITWDEKTGMFNSLMQPKQPKIDPLCMSLIRRVFEQDFGIDGFAYDYSSQYFAECKFGQGEGEYDRKPTRRIRGVAFVITGSSWVTRDNVRIYTPHTVDAKEDRIRISSLFYRGNYDDIRSDVYDGPSAARWARSQSYSRVPGYRVVDDEDGSEKCEKYDAVRGCLDKLKFCKQKPDYTVDKKKCVELDPPELPRYPVVMTDKNWPERAYEAKDKKLFMWDDLIGSETDKNIGSWIDQNLLGCSNRAPYRNLRK